MRPILEIETVASMPLDEVLADPGELERSGVENEPTLFPAVVIGVITSVDECGRIMVTFNAGDDRRPRYARSTVPLGIGDLGSEVTLLFEEGNPARPIIVGIIQRPQPTRGQRASQGQNDSEGHEPASADSVVESSAPKSNVVVPRDDCHPLDAVIDGERIVLSAEQEIVLRCGQASITLTRAGKVLIRGAHVLSRSSGANRIKGGCVQIN